MEYVTIEFHQGNDKSAFLYRPVLAIELDGKYHREPVQMERGRKKEEALERMGIPLWRIKSKETWTEEQIKKYLQKMNG